MKKTSLTMLCALGAAVTAPALASESDVGRSYFTPQVGYLRADSERPTDRDNVIGGFALGRHFSEAWSAEVVLNGAALDGETPAVADLSVYAGSLDLLRVFNRAGNFSPYIGIGAGAINNDLKPGSAGNDAMAQASIGAFWTIWESDEGTSFGLRPDIKARWDDAHSAGRLLDYMATLGFQFQWGGEKKAPPPPPAATSPTTATSSAAPAATTTPG